jgi:histone acetyltransferase (RNA polymerase elongator complex component)
LAKHKNLAIFVPHAGCPQKCSFCDQNVISETEEIPTPEKVSELCDEFLPTDTNSGKDYEIAFFGGSFTAIEEDYMISLLQVACPYVKSGRAKGIRCSTRPDAIDSHILDILKMYSVTSVELGAQSMDDEVLKKNLRGHSANDVFKASQLIKDYGFSLGLQMMTGLYGRRDYMEDALYTAGCFCKIKPDTVRIYPTITLKNTLLAHFYEKGLYKPPTLSETIEICANIVPVFEKANIKIIKLGLHADRSIEKNYVAGPYHPAFKELVESRIFFDKVKIELSNKEKGRWNIIVNEKNLSQMIGQSKENIKKFAKLGYNVKVKSNHDIKSGEFTIEKR